jgi:hypothetical protein
MQSYAMQRRADLCNTMRHVAKLISVRHRHAKRYKENAIKLYATLSGASQLINETKRNRTQRYETLYNTMRRYATRCN